jgi:hypothetical protein
VNLEVKRAFVLADWMKAAQRCESEEQFRTLLASELNRISFLREHEIDQIILRDKERLMRFEESQWELVEISVAECFVWPRMDQRPWAIGNVREVAEKFLRMEPAGSRIWRMKLFAAIFSSDLPIIIFRRDGRLEIDDGSHRAVALHLAGFEKTKAYVGLEKKA